MKRLNRRTETEIKPIRKRRALLTTAGLGAWLACTAPVALAASSGAGAGRKVVMVVQLNGPNLAADQKIAAHLGARGYSVRMLDQAQPPVAIGDADLVVISSTVSSRQVASGWRYLAKPLLTWENDLLDDFAMTGKRHD